MRKLKIIIIRIFIIFLLAGFALGAFYAVSGFADYRDLMSDMPLDEKVTEVQSQDNYTTLDQLPQIYLDAVVSVEDHRFYEHNGLDLIGISRAVVRNIRKRSFIEGGSTLTQQVAKNLYLSQERALIRKVTEAFIALQIERYHDKDTILELYVNTIYFGDNYYSVYDASMGYFNKEPIEMTDYESTLLAGIPNAPSVYAPTQNPELAEQRQKHVIEQMIMNEKLTREQAETILNE
ncbi:MAG: transglycosylase domain-containing protein [Dethiobacteria bacterium]